MSFKAQMTYLLLHIISKILNRVSNRSASGIGQRVGSLVYHYFPVRSEVAQKNLEKAFPQQSIEFYHHTLKQAYCHFGEIFIDALRLSTFNFDKRIIVENREVLNAAFEERKGVILLSGHLGNWEIIPVWFAKNGFLSYPIARRQKNKGANKFFMELREKTGTHPFYAGSQAQKMLHALKKGGILGLASDQDARRKGVFVDFFGIPSSTPRGAAIFHLKTGAPMIMGLCLKDSEGKYHLKFTKVPTMPRKNTSVKTITQQFTSILEMEVRKNPEQYFWFHRRWKTKPRNKTGT